ncbi:50S ribosomal protein L24e [Candidatus Micrarchaeota archaeon]|nr:50S ribosomal protein L24e [Candidatus Micrarchaeota archaeon]
MRCSFCNTEIANGKAYIFAKKDGTTVTFCSSKCKSNQLGLSRVGKKAPWVKRRKSPGEKKK